MAFSKICGFNELEQRVLHLDALHEDKMLKPGNRAPKFEDFSEAGLSSAGTKFGFPARFVTSLFDGGHPDLAQKIINAKVKDYLDLGQPFLLRKWDNRIEGVVSNRYGIFDDKEVVDILSKSPYLQNSEEIWFNETPFYFHTRFISPNHLRLDGDDSDLSMAVFVDNSMAGNGSFRVRFGLYRWACTNGCISGLKSFEIVKQIHKSGVQFARDLNAALVEVPRYEEMLMDMAKKMSTTRSSIYGMTEEQALAYISKRLLASDKISKDVLEKYNSYGGRTKWDLVNAITDKAHDLSDMERVRFETLALRVA